MLDFLTHHVCVGVRLLKNSLANKARGTNRFKSVVVADGVDDVLQQVIPSCYLLHRKLRPRSALRTQHGAVLLHQTPRV